MTADPVTLQLISNSLLYASEEMGLALRNAAYSPNIKERMDHSAAVFDREGRLLAQAEHIPVHLGSLPWGLKNLIERCNHDGLALEEGSMLLANDPYVTGTHLNDVTVAAPIHWRGELVGFAVNKAHHSDVGGRVPGSISMDATTLYEEGIVIEPSYVWRKGEFVEGTANKLIRGSRTPKERGGDLRAQVAANLTGARRVTSTLTKYGLEAFDLAAASAFRHSKSMTLKRLAKFKPGSYSATDYIEGPAGEDLKLRVKVSLSSSRITVDYAGTHRQVDYPLNAVLGVTISGAYFVIRCLIGDDIPANYGAFVPVEVRAPVGSLLNPTPPHPVGGGNVETSQRNADVLFRAFAGALPGSVPAAAGGSMNNVMIGGKTGQSQWAFYETIGVGLGGSSFSDGVDGIQANMTNTMNTPIEEIERSLPIIIAKYEFRPDSPGQGRNRGGAGLVRSYKALEDGITFTVLADRGIHPPWGLEGGGSGARTEVWFRRKGSENRVPLKSSHILLAGDEFEMRTAGGGGYGDPVQRSSSKEKYDLSDGIITSRGNSNERRTVIKSHIRR